MDSPEPQKRKLSKMFDKIQSAKNEMIKNLAESILEALQEECLYLEDPFENYEQQLRMRVCRETKVFSSRFIKGYESLLEELQSESESESGSGSGSQSPPPQK